ncbi:hypothetical protein ACFV4N_24835 [Actinosynnema sp. NPDC059797]
MVASMGAKRVVPAGTLVWRVTQGAARGRRTLSVAPNQVTALVEHLAPGSRFTDGGRRVRRDRVAGAVLGALRATTDLVLLDAGGDRELTPAYLAGVRASEPPVHGVSRPSAADLPRPAWELFTDRCADGVLSAVPELERRLDAAGAAPWLNDLLAAYRLEVPPGDLPAVFLNYRNGDSLDVVKQLDAVLCRRIGPELVFRAGRSLVPGREFPVDLLRMAGGARVLVAVIGTKWETAYDANGTPYLHRPDDWVRREIAEALRNRVRVVPLLVGARPRLNGASLPEDIRRLALLQDIHVLRESTDAVFEAVADELLKDVPGLPG